MLDKDKISQLQQDLLEAARVNRELSEQIIQLKKELNLTKTLFKQMEDKFQKIENKKAWTKFDDKRTSGKLLSLFKNTKVFNRAGNNAPCVAFI